MFLLLREICGKPLFIRRSVLLAGLGIYQIEEITVLFMVLVPEIMGITNPMRGYCCRIDIVRITHHGICSEIILVSHLSDSLRAAGHRQHSQKA